MCGAKKVGLGVLALVLLAAGVVVWLARPVPVFTTVDVTGTPGMALVGTREIDGKSEPLASTIPMHFTMQGHAVSFAIDSDAKEGEFTVKAVTLHHADPMKVTSSAETNGHAPDDVVRFSAKSGWAWSMPLYGIASGNEKAGKKAPR